MGHSGTLDPFATGLLIVLSGRATRAQRFFMGLDKTYEVEARFGATSSTGDPEGEIIESGEVPSGDLELPVGIIRQAPPAWSAVKVGGVRAYRLARMGIEPDLEEREVRVDEFTETGRDGHLRSFRIRCSSGTYVRSLISDLGHAYCVSLRRTAIGPFAIDQVAGTECSLLDGLLQVMPSVEAGDREAADLVHGRQIADPRAEGDREGELCVVNGGNLVAVAASSGSGMLRTLIGFPPE